MNRTEIQRAASAANRLRPDWRADSLETFLGRHVADRPYRDVVIALAVIATDPDATTPDLLRKDGPWWTAAHVAQRMPESTGVTPADRCPHHGGPLPCRPCAEHARSAITDPARIRAIRAAARLGAAQQIETEGDQQ